VKLIIFTIVLDGSPFIQKHLSVFEQLSCEWEWRVAEGAAANTHCTAWCKPQQPRFSRDGTTEYLTSLLDHPNVKIFRRQLWDGKVNMCNACLNGLDEECVLVQADVDEFFSAKQLEQIVEMFQNRPEATHAYFWCRYWMGKNIVSTSVDGYGNRRVGEWARAFRFKPGMAFSRHEPPVFNNNHGVAISRDETRAMGLVFEHYAWLLESQARTKEKFYGYGGAERCWKLLQENKKWPVSDLRTFLPWVGPNASADFVSEGVGADILK
jgi:hypothetical protein